MVDRSQDARSAILDAAERLFAERGFSATSIKMIGNVSRQNTALIYYYFDSKAALYRHVLGRILGEIAREASERGAGSDEPESTVRAVVQSQVAVFARRPHLPLLLAREIIDWKAAHAEEAIRALAATLFERLCAALADGQRSGRFRPDFNPRFAALSIISQVAYLMLAQPVAGILLGRGASGPTFDDVRVFGEHATEFALAALCARAHADTQLATRPAARDFVAPPPAPVT